MPSRFYIIFIFLPVALSACKKNQCAANEKYFCSGGNLSVTFAGFSSFQVDSVYIVQYQKGSDFSIVVDTTKWYPQITGNEVLLNWIYDTVYLGLSINPIDANYDSEIIIGGNKTVRFSNIIIGSSNYNCCDEGDLSCFHSLNLCPVTSYQQNGVTMTAVPAIVTN